MNPIIHIDEVKTNLKDRLADTVRLIGQGIVEASTYQPLRLHAANLATKASHKDYLGQLQAIYNDFLGRWRYVRDPVGLETVATTGPAVWGLVAGDYSPQKRGHGDCDDSTVYLGAAAQAIGLPVRIVTMAGPRSRQHSHVYPEVQLPKRGWIAMDAVAHPKPMGHHPPASERIRWNLQGQQIGRQKGVNTMNTQQYDRAMLGMLADVTRNGWSAKPLEVYGLAGLDGEEPEAFGDFGAEVDNFDAMVGRGIMAESVPWTTDGYTMTPILELGIDDYLYLQDNELPYIGMLATDMDDELYKYQEIPDESGQLHGWFKRLRRRIRRRFKKIARGIKRIAKKIIKRIPGGKYLLKFGRRLKKIALKMVKPLIKLVGKAAPFLAKVAAFIPGYGPAIAAGLHMAGRVAKIMSKVGVKKKKGKLAFTSGKQMALFKKLIKRAAKKQRRRGRARRRRA